ncbi:MAG: hypothetical protein ACFFC7_06590 [Candidatus Hermodarchaeota archaeon]
MSIPVGNLSLDVFQRFFRQRTFLEKSFFIVTLIWFIIAFLPSGVLLRSLSFSLLIGNLFLFGLERTVQSSRDNILWEQNIFFPLAFRTFLFYLPIHLIAVEETATKFLLFDIPLPFWELERDIIALIFLAATLFRSVDLRLLVTFRDPINFILKSLRGIWLCSLALLIIGSLGYFVNIQSNSVFFLLVQRPILEYLVLGGLCANIIGSIRPIGKQSTLSIQDFRRTSITERARGGFLGSFFVLFILIILGWLGNPTETFVTGITSGEFWTTTVILLLIVGLLLFLPSKKPRERVSSSTALAPYEGLDPQIQKNVSQLGSLIQNLRAGAVREAYVLPESNQLFKQGNTTFRAEKGTLAIPIPAEGTSDSTAIVFVGKGQITTRNEIRAVDGPTTIVFSNKEWKAIKNILIPQNWQELAQRLSLSSLIEKAIYEIQNWDGPGQLFSQLSSMTAVDSGKYFIRDTKEGTRISLPFFQIIENKNVEIVKFPFFQIISVKGVGEYVKLPFLHIIDTKQYDAVTSPFFSILSSKNCNVVNILGLLNITEGDTRNLAALIEKVAADAFRFEALLNATLQRVLLDPEMHFISTQSLTGRPVRLLTSGDDTYTDIEEETTKKKMMRMAFETLSFTEEEILEYAEDARRMVDEWEDKD